MFLNVKLYFVNKPETLLDKVVQIGGVSVSKGVFKCYDTWEELLYNNSFDFKLVEVDGTDINEFI